MSHWHCAARPARDLRGRNDTTPKTQRRRELSIYFDQNNEIEENPFDDGDFSMDEREYLYNVEGEDFEEFPDHHSFQPHSFKILH